LFKTKVDPKTSKSKKSTLYVEHCICNVKYCDFVVWTIQGIVAIRIGAYPLR
jgi:hypothetical protein